MGSKLLMEQILSHFPQKHLKYAFAYGSGVFQQHGNLETSKNMIDFVFAVDNPVQWHSENMINNRSHYSVLSRFGPKYISYIQDNHGARVYYNTLVSCEGRLIKYGVISTRSLINDLLDWETLYVSGRLHKPVTELLHGQSDSDLSKALVANLQSAIHTALLLLPEQFSEEELFATIAGLSYTGDFRMTIGEDRNKVISIVRPNVGNFRKLYELHILNSKHLQWDKSKGMLQQSDDPASRYHHLNLLPKWLMFAVVNVCNSDGRHRDTEEVLRSLAKDSECREVVEGCVSSIVKYSSLSQSAKGILTAGFLKSVKYSFKKLKKMLKI